MWKRFGIQRFWSWLCSRLLSSQRLSAAALFSRSAWSAFIRPLNLLKCCLFFSCLLTLSLVSGIKPVFAQCPGPGCPTPEVTRTPRPTSTPGPPTPTFSPLFPTETQGPTPDYNCPTGQPIGAGVVTPNPSWKLNCGHCLTPVPGYVWATLPPPAATFDWDTYFDATAAPANTPTALANTSTAIPPSSVGGEAKYLAGPYPNSTGNLTKEVASTVSWSNTYIFYGGNKGKAAGPYPQTLGIRISAHVKFVTGSNWCGPGARLKYGGVNGYTTPNGYDFVVMESNIDQLPAGTARRIGSGQSWIVPITEGGCGGTYEKDIDLRVNVTFRNDNMYYDGWPITFEMYSGYQDTTIEGTTTAIFYDGPVPLTPPPPPASDCAAINGVGDPGDPDNMFNSKWFSLPYIGVGVGQCFGLEQITINLTFLQTFVQSLPDSISTPGFEICLVPIALGSVNFFGIPIDFDSWAIILAGVLMFKVLTRF